MKKTWMYRALSTAGVASALLIPGAGAADDTTNTNDQTDDTTA